MAGRRVLERLWRLRELEEEQSRLELEAKVGDRNRAAQRLAGAVESAAHSRKTFAATLSDPDTSARQGALLAWEQARRRQIALRPRLEQAEGELERGREEFLARRTERRQVETLLEREQKMAREETARRAQQMLDDWYGRRIADRQRSDAGGELVVGGDRDATAASMNSV